MTIHYETHIKEEGYAPSSQRSRYQHLRGSVRCALAKTAGKDRYERSRTCRKERGIENKHFELGVCHPQTSRQRRSFKTCGSPRSERPHSFTERVEVRRLSSTIFTPIFQASEKFATAHVPIFLTWRKFTKIHALYFQEPNGFSERNFGQYPFCGIDPLTQYHKSGKMSPVIQNIGSPNRLSPALRPARFVSQQKQPIAEGRGFFTYTAGHGKASLGRARRGTAGSGVDGTGKA